MARQVEKQRGKTKHVVISTINGIVAKLPISENMAQFSTYLCKRLDSRQRLSEADHEEMRAETIATLKNFVDSYTDVIKKIAREGVVEVTIPFVDADLNPKTDTTSLLEHAMLMPWEYVLSAVTKKYRGNLPLVVVRHLDGNNSATQPSRQATKQDAKGKEGGFCFLETAPGQLAEYDFSNERKLVSGALAELKEVELEANPSIAKLKGTVKRRSPDVMHISGIDTRLGMKLSEKTLPDHVVDGLYFTNAKSVRLVDYRKFAEAISSGKQKAQLVGLNCQYSGARIAPSCIAAGARVAIGIQNSLDDGLAESFFYRFYQHWNASNQDSLAAFIAAWEHVKPMAMSIKGSGIILWFNTSVFARSKKLIEPSLKGIEKVVSQIKNEQLKHDKEAIVADPAKDKIKDLVSVTVQPLDTITPCKLHYGESVLKQLYFLFKNLHPTDNTPHCIEGIDVEVTLTVGQESYPYRTRVSLGVDHPNLELTDSKFVGSEYNPPGGIQVPLTSNLIRKASDNVRASVYVNVEWEGQVLHRHTYSIKIAAVNEWLLDDTNCLLQPMFVQPRDSAVKDIVIAAQKYLSCIAGSAAEGFSGYQADDIEPQMAAIWQALLYDFKLEYVSPPPSYNMDSQRLRTPTDVLRDRRGTCIDLAHLYASCLEWVELYPVIINTDCHTFIGCWRYDAEIDDDNPRVCEETGGTILSHAKFMELHKKGEFSNDGSHPWVLPVHDFKLVSSLIYNEAIIPLETVCVTQFKLFEYAKNYAIEYFLKDQEMLESGKALECQGDLCGDFESVLDVKSARKFLQPLPMS
jgi:hypothetical protein